MSEINTLAIKVFPSREDANIFMRNKYAGQLISYEVRKLSVAKGFYVKDVQLSSIKKNEYMDFITDEVS